jgi:hypothetical protein
MTINAIDIKFRTKNGVTTTSGYTIFHDECIKGTDLAWQARRADGSVVAFGKTRDALRQSIAEHLTARAAEMEAARPQRQRDEAVGRIVYRVSKARATLANIARKITDGDLGALRWNAVDGIEAEATLPVYVDVASRLLSGDEFSAVRADVERRLISAARFASRSTNMGANIAQQGEIEALAEILDTLNGVEDGPVTNAATEGVKVDRDITYAVEYRKGNK